MKVPLFEEFWSRLIVLSKASLKGYKLLNHDNKFHDLSVGYMIYTKEEVNYECSALVKRINDLLSNKELTSKWSDDTKIPSEMGDFPKKSWIETINGVEVEFELPDEFYEKDYAEAKRLNTIFTNALLKYDLDVQEKVKREIESIKDIVLEIAALNEKRKSKKTLKPNMFYIKDKSGYLEKAFQLMKDGQFFKEGTTLKTFEKLFGEWITDEPIEIRDDKRGAFKLFINKIINEYSHIFEHDISKHWKHLAPLLLYKGGKQDSSSWRQTTPTTNTKVKNIIDMAIDHFPKS